jgi:predicted nuclease with TOPRIM domain
MSTDRIIYNKPFVLDENGKKVYIDKEVQWKNEGEMVEWGNKIRDLTNENKKLRDMLKMSYSKFTQCLSDCKKLKKKLEEEEDHSCSLSRILYEMKNRADPDEFVDWDLRLGNYQQYRDAVDDDEAISPMSSGQSSDAE